MAKRRLPTCLLTTCDDAESLGYGEANLYIGNLRAMVRDLEPPEREREIVEWLKAIENLGQGSKERNEAVGSWPSAEPRLRPKLVPADHVERLVNMVYQPFAADVAIAYGIDLGQADCFVMEAHLAEWNVSPTTVHATALANLEAMSTDIGIELFHAPHVEGRYAAVLSGDAYDASRVLLPKFRARLLATLGQPSALAGIPDRDCLLAWTADFVNRNALIAQVRDDVRMRPHPLTDTIFVLTPDAVRVAAREDLRS